MNRVCSIFSQLLQLFSRVEFEAAVRKHKAERHARGFTCWGQFVAMLFCQLGRAHSLREICQGLAASEGKLKHLGVPTAPSRSTLAYGIRSITERHSLPPSSHVRTAIGPSYDVLSLWGAIRIYPVPLE